MAKLKRKAYNKKMKRVRRKARKRGEDPFDHYRRAMQKGWK